MKKILALIIACLMLLSLCACGGSEGSSKDSNETQSATETAPDTTLEVGYGKVNITPTYSVGLGGSGNEKIRRSEGITSYLFATCIALRQAGETYLVYTVDTLSVNDQLADELRLQILQELPDIKLDNIYIAATHSHSCPTPYWSDNEPEGKYRQEFINWIPQAAKLAIKDLAPATMEVTQFSVPDMSFVRHYIMNDGTYAGDQFGDASSGYKEETYDPDDEMILINFPREGKESVLLVNWAAHPSNPYDSTIGYRNISADHPGWCRDKLEQLIGNTKVAYFNGASGDLDFYHYNKEKNHGLLAKPYGEKLAEIAYEHYNELKPVEITPIKTTTRDVTLTVEHELEHLLPQAVEIWDIYSVQGNKKLANEEAYKIGLGSCFHASAIISRSKAGQSEAREVNAIALGPVGFVTVTYEMASEHALEVKAAAPFDTVFIMSGNNRYLPREEAIDYHAYEGDTRRYTRDAADLMVKNQLEMLNELK